MPAGDVGRPGFDRQPPAARHSGQPGTIRAVALPPIPDTYEEFMEVVERIPKWFRGQAGSSSGPLDHVPREVARPVLEGACPYCPDVRLDAAANDASTLLIRAPRYDHCSCCGHSFELYPTEPAGRGFSQVIGHDRCGHVRAFLLARGMAFTGGYYDPPRAAWEYLRHGEEPPPRLT
jgi:hypothetical protein